MYIVHISAGVFMRHARNETQTVKANERLKLTQNDMNSIKKTMDKIHKDSEKRRARGEPENLRFYEFFS
jgi:hypothetical protein